MSHHPPPAGYPARHSSYQHGPPHAQPHLQNSSSYPSPPPQYYQQQPGPPYAASPYQPQTYQQASPYSQPAPAYSQPPPPTAHQYAQGHPPSAYSQPPPSAYNHHSPYTSAPQSTYSGMYPNPPPSHQQHQPSQPGYPGGYAGQPPTAQQPYQQPYHNPLPPNASTYNYGGLPPPGPAQYVASPTQYAPNYGSGSLLHAPNSNGYGAATAPPPPPPTTVALDATGLPAIPGDEVRCPCKLKVSEKVWDATRDSFSVTDHRKRPLYTVDGSRTADQYKVLKNAKGQALLQMRQRSSLKTKMQISDMQGKSLLTLIRARTDGRDHKRIDGHLGGDASSPAVLLVVGNGSCTSFKIENAHEVVIADVTRPARTLKRVFTGQDDYSVDVITCSPALITMIVVAIDEMYCDEGS